MNHTSIRQVTSAANSLVKIYRRGLREGETRQGWLAIEGPHLIEEALRPGARATVRSLLVTPEAAEKWRPLMVGLPPETEVAQVSAALFRQISQTEAPQGMAALVELAPPSLDSLLHLSNALLLVAGGIQDPGNLGTMLRSAHALGAHALLTLHQSVSPLNPKAVRASAGAIFHLPVLASLDSQNLIMRLREKRFRIVAAESGGRVLLSETDLRGSVAFLIGREGSGLDADLLRLADIRVKVPVRPGVDSLNASVAAGIFLYEAARQRQFNL